MSKNITVLIGSLALVFGCLFLSNLIANPLVGEWYTLLKKPDFTLPEWVYGPLWLVLYFLIALSLYFYWRAAGRFLGYLFFGLQLFLNLI